MDSKKAERLEKHKKEIKRKAFLNLFLTLTAGIGIGLLLWGPVADILSLLIGDIAMIATVLLFIGFGSIVYISPIIHFKEKYKLKSNKKTEYYLERGLEKTPMIQFMETQGWEEVEVTEDKIKLETYPSFLHKTSGRKTTMEIEVLEKDGNEETAVTRINGKKVEKIKTTVEPEEEGSLISETAISIKRFSPAYLELLLFMLPQMQDALKDAAEEELELLDENIEYGISKFNLESE